MFPYTFEIVTAITVTVISIILALYFIVLKRKGWLTENSNKSSYRCPNPECRKIFDEPVMLTDLSQNSSRKYSACPHCGFGLETASPSAVGKKAKMTFKTPRSPRESVGMVKNSEPETPTVAKDIQKPTASPKPLQARPPACSHFIGYLRKIPKNSLIPDECYSCPKMVECISYDISEQT